MKNSARNFLTRALAVITGLVLGIAVAVMVIMACAICAFVVIMLSNDPVYINIDPEFGSKLFACIATGLGALTIYLLVRLIPKPTR